MSTRRWSPRRGFTLIELLVVIAIIAVLIGLLLPAIQKVREAANRLQCQNNFKQLGLAVHDYASANNNLPPAWRNVWPGVPTSATIGDRESIFVLLLPYIEQDNLYNLGSTATGFKERGAAIGGSVVKTYLCPSDPTNSGGYSTRPGNVTPAPWNLPWASSNYAANLLVFDPSGPGTVVSAMSDGTSNTVMLGHRYRDCDAAGILPKGTLPLYAESDWAADATDAPQPLYSIPVFGWQTYAAINGGGKTQTTGCPVALQNRGGCWAGTGYASPAAIFSSNSSNAQLPDITSGKAYAPSAANLLLLSGLPFGVSPRSSQGAGACNFQVLNSPHTGSMIVGMGDGSVRTVASGVSLATWYIACVPNDGFPMGSDW
jgi:prepilin-type N-terminal cleavage/methylation domain-containing protein